MRIHNVGQHPPEATFVGICDHCGCRFDCAESETLWEPVHYHTVNHWLCSAEYLKSGGNRYVPCPTCRKPVYVWEEKK